MRNKPLHIVCLDAPSPPDYGGAIDMYYKIVALSKYHEITLHYFDYKKDRNTVGLEPYCKAIHSYSRKSIIKSGFTLQTYIVLSRINEQLINRLNADDHPVLLEGIHCAGIVPHLDKSRKLVMRMHNDEAEYYRLLVSSEKKILKKSFLFLESLRLKKYQEDLKKDLPLACVSYTDMQILKEKYRLNNLHFIPSFTPWQQLESFEGKGTYCLYQGNLEVPENSQVVIELMENVFSKIQTPFYIAGKGINRTINRLAKKYSHIHLFNSPTDSEMNSLVKNAQINILPSLNNTGLKLKMLHALFYGRHCITNNAGIAGTAFKEAVTIANTPDEYITQINHLINLPFTKNDLLKRQVIAEVYNNEKNAALLSALL